MEKELYGLEKGLKAKILIDLLRATLKKYQIGKWQAMMAYMDTGLKNSLPSTRLAIEMDRCLEETIYLNEWPKERPLWSKKSPVFTLKGTTRDPKRAPDDVKNINDSNQGRNLLFANKPRIVHRRTERMLKGNKGNKRSTTHRSTHPQGAQNKTKKIAVAWIDYKKAYDRVQQSCIIDCHKMYTIFNEVIKFIENTMKNWRI